MTKDKKILQITLISFGVFLILITYFLYPKINKEKNRIAKIDEETVVLQEETESNVFENLQYKGFYDINTPFNVESKKAYISDDDPDLVYMTGMEVTLFLDGDKIIKIISDKGKYNKKTYDCFFVDNVVADDGQNKIFADNLDLLATKEITVAYNDVKFFSKEGKLQADKVEYNFKTRYYKISMFNDKSIKAKYIK